MGNNTGQVALTIVGTAVGASFGMPGLGMTLGSMAGQALFPTDLGTVNGPRLSDLSVQTSTIGAPIPLVYGTFAISGNVIWSSGIIEKKSKKKQGGKGGPTQTLKTYSYSVNCAVGICEGPIDGIRRIWADAKLVYDSRPQQPDESDEQYNERYLAALSFLSASSFYLGSEDQLPDPTIESFEGAGDVSGYRGLAYVVFSEFQLEEYGNRVPNFRFEIVRLFDNGGTDVPDTVFRKPVDTIRDAADGRTADPDLRFSTEAASDYWVLGILSGRKAETGGSPGLSFLPSHSTSIVGWQSSESTMQEYSDPSELAYPTNVWVPRPRALSEFGTKRIALSTGEISTTTLWKFYHDAVIQTNTAGEFTINWGLSDLGSDSSSALMQGSWIWAKKLTAEDGWGVVRKSSATSRNTTSLSDDPDLIISLDGGSTYMIRGTLFLRAPATSDIKVGPRCAVATKGAGFIHTLKPMYSASSDPTWGDMEGGAITMTDLTAGNTRDIDGTGNSSTYTSYWTHYVFSLLIETGSAGNFAIRWAQDSLDAVTPAVVLAGSSLTYRKLA